VSICRNSDCLMVVLYVGFWQLHYRNTRTLPHMTGPSRGGCNGISYPGPGVALDGPASRRHDAPMPQHLSHLNSWCKFLKNEFSCSVVQLITYFVAVRETVYKRTWRLVAGWLFVACVPAAEAQGAVWSYEEHRRGNLSHRRRGGRRSDRGRHSGHRRHPVLDERQRLRVRHA